MALNDTNPVEILREKQAKIHADTVALKAAVAAAGRVEFTDDESAQLSSLTNSFDALSHQIDLHERTASLEAAISKPQERIAKPDITPVPAYRGPSVTGGIAVSATHANHGFTRGLAEFLQAVKNAAYGRTDQRLTNAVTTFGGDATVNGGTDGGFAVPPQFTSVIQEYVAGEDSLLSKFNPIMTSSNMVTIPTDETTAWGTTGIYAEWLGEGTAMTARAPSLKQVNVTLHKVGALVYLSDELAADAPAIQSHIARKVAQAIAGKVSAAVVAGDGLAKPLGLLKAPALVTVTKSASTLAALDLANMTSRLLPSGFGNSFWLMHTSVLPYVWTLTLGQMPVYQQDFRVSPYGALLGRPIFVSEYCSDYNTAGDLFLVSPDGYVAAMKAGGIETAMSIHFAFDQGLQAYRATARVGGTPLATAAVTRKNGSNTLSHIVCMGVRS